MSLKDDGQLRMTLKNTIQVALLENLAISFMTVSYLVLKVEKIIEIKSETPFYSITAVSLYLHSSNDTFLKCVIMCDKQVRSFMRIIKAYFHLRMSFSFQFQHFNNKNRCTLICIINVDNSS